MSGTKRIFQHLPHFFRSENTESLVYRFLSVFGAMLDAQDEDLLAVMRSHWVKTAHNIGSKGLDTQQKGDLDKILALYLEALGGTSLLRQINRRTGEEGLEDDRLYRNRMLELIRLLGEGASTVAGIRAVVAANLGIFGNTPEAKAARDSITITEYLPQTVERSVSVALFEVFQIKSPNPETTPMEITLRSLAQYPDLWLKNLVVEELTTGRVFQWVGTPISGGQKQKIYINGFEVEHNDKPVPDQVSFPYGPLLLPPGVSYWRIRSILGEFGHAAGSSTIPTQQEEGQYKAAHPQRTFNHSLAVFAPSGPFFEATFGYTQFKPAAFRVSIPWILPGGGNYTEILDGMPDRPRLQIPYIVNRVKAAGVWAEIAYRMNFTEILTMEDQVAIELEDYTYQENQEIADGFQFGGVFDHTRYDQSVFQ